MGGLTEHVVASSARTGTHQAVTPVQDLVPIRKPDDGDRAVDVLARLERLYALWRVEPGLGEDSECIEIARAGVVEGLSGIVVGKLVGPRLRPREWREPGRLPVE